MAKDVSRQTLDSVPSRVLTFLIGLGELPTVRALLMKRGYSHADHEFAFNRLAKLALIAQPPEQPSAVHDAVAELDAWDDVHLPCIRAAIVRLHKPQVSLLIDGLEPGRGLASVLVVEQLLNRVDAVREGKGRSAAEHEDDLRALETLAARGYTPEELRRLRSVVNTAKTLEQVTPISDDGRKTTLLELYEWLSDWSAQAKAVVGKRSQLIQLGLAKRRKSKPEIAPVQGDDGSGRSVERGGSA